MARFQVPSVSPPSTPGSCGTRSSSSSTSTPPVHTSGPNTFRVPSATPSIAGEAQGQRSRSRSISPSGSPSTRKPMSGSFGDSQSPPGSQESNRSKRTRSPTSELSTPRRRRITNHGFWPARPLGLRQESVDDFFRQTTPVPGGVSYDPDAPGSSSSSSSDKSGAGHGGGGSRGGDPSSGGVSDLDYISSSPTDTDRTGSDITDTDLDEQEQWMPLVGHQPERLPGRLGAVQPFPSQHLTLLKERPGRLPAHTARSPTSPGWDWTDGAAWWHPAGSAGRQNVAREIFTPTGFKVIEQEVAEETANLMSHENLVNVLDGDGFGADKENTRREVLYEFCSGGTLNKLILSRKPQPPLLKPRRAATYLPTKEVVLGLPEDLVWHVLLSLLRATYWLHHRRQPVVHCAIDPANLFFTAPKPNDRRPLVKKYGLVKLGNFSKAVILPHAFDPDRNDYDEILDRCSMFEHMITEDYKETGYEAPEMLGMLGEDEISDEKIFPGPCSDLFSIGVTCFAMMTGKTVWDLLLERRFITRSHSPNRMDRAVLEEKWRFSDYNERMEMLKAVLRGEQVLGDALPGFYSREIRKIVEGLLNLDPEMRGESAALLDEAEDAFAEKCAGRDGNALEEMRRIWKVAVRQPKDREQMDEAIRVADERSGSAKAWRRQREIPQPPLVP